MAALRPGIPFPGMDPWMALRWGGVHTSLVVYASDQIQGDLPDDLIADIESRTFNTSDPLFRPVPPPDIRVGVPTLAEPVLVAVPDAEVRQRLVTIREATGERVVTVIEFLSPTNKRPGNGLRSYHEKQADCLATGVNLVEVDLLRGGRRPFPFDLPGADAADYAVSVWRAARPGRAEFYPVGLRDRLRAFRIPLRPADEDVVLDLQPIVDLAHRNGALHRLDHTRPLDPPLSADDAAWAEERLAAHAG